MKNAQNICRNYPSNGIACKRYEDFNDHLSMRIDVYPKGLDEE